MEKILALWAIPRSASTAFERMMRQRGDHSVHDEPFGISYYYSDDRRDTTRYPDIEPDSQYNFDVVLERLKNERERLPVFLKDISYQVVPVANAEFLSHFESSFLIRHPAKVLPSLFHNWPDFSLEETGYAALTQILETVKELTRKAPVLIDSDDLVQRPETTIRAYCQAVDIPFIEEAMKWKPGVQPEITQWGGGWHDYTQSSEGFKEQKKNDYARIDDHEHLKRAYEYCLPYYRELYEQRLRIQ